MSEWVSEAPTFAVVGKINMGKSSVLSTLLEIDDDSVVRISNTPGETTMCQAMPVVFGGQEMIRFVDTPGFSRALEAMRLMQEMHGEGSPNLETVKRFVREQMNKREFADEARLLEPLCQGAGILYVIDPSKPIRDAFVAEMEIMRWTGRPRMALLNEKGDNPERLEEWRSRLGSYFNLVRTFNAHRARFGERRRLLRSLLEIDETNKEKIEQTIDFIDEEWERRREESAQVVKDFLSKVMQHRESVALNEKEDSLEHLKERKKEELTKKYYKSIAKFEKKAYEKFLKIYRHGLLKLEVAEEDFEGIDLSSEETWKKWGLSRSQITLAGGVTGGLAGGAIDLASGGLTGGFGTLLGAVSGAAGAYFKGDSLPELRLDATTGGVGVGGTTAKNLVLGPPENDNFAWILLDRMLHHYKEIVSRSHGRRDEELVKRAEADAGRVRGFSRERRSTIQKWLVTQANNKPSPLDNEVFLKIKEVLEEVEQEE